MRHALDVLEEAVATTYPEYQPIVAVPGRDDRNKARVLVLAVHRKEEDWILLKAKRTSTSYTLGAPASLENLALAQLLSPTTFRLTFDPDAQSILVWTADKRQEANALVGALNEYVLCLPQELSTPSPRWMNRTHESPSSDGRSGSTVVTEPDSGLNVPHMGYKASSQNLRMPRQRRTSLAPRDDTDDDWDDVRVSPRLARHSVSIPRSRANSSLYPPEPRATRRSSVSYLRDDDPSRRDVTSGRRSRASIPQPETPSQGVTPILTFDDEEDVATPRARQSVSIRQPRPSRRSVVGADPSPGRNRAGRRSAPHPEPEVPADPIDTEDAGLRVRPRTRTRRVAVSALAEESRLKPAPQPVQKKNVARNRPTPFDSRAFEKALVDGTPFPSVDAAVKAMSVRKPRNRQVPRSMSRSRSHSHSRVTRVEQGPGSGEAPVTEPVLPDLDDPEAWAEAADLLATVGYGLTPTTGGQKGHTVRAGDVIGTTLQAELGAAEGAYRMGLLSAVGGPSTRPWRSARQPETKGGTVHDRIVAKLRSSGADAEPGPGPAWSPVGHDDLSEWGIFDSGEVDELLDGVEDALSQLDQLYDLLGSAQDGIASAAPDVTAIRKARHGDQLVASNAQSLVQELERLLSYSSAPWPALEPVCDPAGPAVLARRRSVERSVSMGDLPRVLVHPRPSSPARPDSRPDTRELRSRRSMDVARLDPKRSMDVGRLNPRRSMDVSRFDTRRSMDASRGKPRRSMDVSRLDTRKSMEVRRWRSPNDVSGPEPNEISSQDPLLARQSNDAARSASRLSVAYDPVGDDPALDGMNDPWMRPRVSVDLPHRNIDRPRKSMDASAARLISRSSTDVRSMMRPSMETVRAKSRPPPGELERPWSNMGVSRPLSVVAGSDLSNGGVTEALDALLSSPLTAQGDQVAELENVAVEVYKRYLAASDPRAREAMQPSLGRFGNRFTTFAQQMLMAAVSRPMSAQALASSLSLPRSPVPNGPPQGMALSQAIEAALEPYCGIVLFVRETAPKSYRALREEYATTVRGACYNVSQWEPAEGPSALSPSMGSSSPTPTLSIASTIRLIHSVTGLMAAQHSFVVDLLHLSSVQITFADYLSLEPVFVKQAAQLREETPFTTSDLQPEPLLDQIFAPAVQAVEARVEQERHDGFTSIALLSSLESALAPSTRPDAPPADGMEYALMALTSLRTRLVAQVDQLVQGELQMLGQSLDAAPSLVVPAEEEDKGGLGRKLTMKRRNSQTHLELAKGAAHAHILPVMHRVPAWIVQVEQLVGMTSRVVGYPVPYPKGTQARLDAAFYRLTTTAVDTVDKRADEAARQAESQPELYANLVRVVNLEAMQHAAILAGKKGKGKALDEVMDPCEEALDEAVDGYVQEMLDRPWGPMREFVILASRVVESGQNALTHERLTPFLWLDVVEDYSSDSVQRLVQALGRRVAKHFGLFAPEGKGKGKKKKKDSSLVRTQRAAQLVWSAAGRTVSADVEQFRSLALTVFRGDASSPVALDVLAWPVDASSINTWFRQASPLAQPTQH